MRFANNQVVLDAAHPIHSARDIFGFGLFHVAVDGARENDRAAIHIDIDSGARNDWIVHEGGFDFGVNGGVIDDLAGAAVARC